MKKILFINKADNLDYLCDCLYHGLCSLDNLYVETLNDYWFMYKGNSDENLNDLYGKGFSISNRIDLSKKHLIDKDSAIKKINEHFYDYIIYGSIYRDSTFFDIVCSKYERDEIAIIDGDDANFHINKVSGGMYVKIREIYRFLINPIKLKKSKSMSKLGVYFKRELLPQYRKYFIPISFAIPEENIVRELPQKKMFNAINYPGRKETYIYKTDIEYNKGYQIAKFGITFRKGGWDCLRHYEILANACIPYFPDIKKCPLTIMTTFPKNIIYETNYLYERKLFNDKLYSYYQKELLEYCKKFLTTKSLAKYVLSYLK